VRFYQIAVTGAGIALLPGQVIALDKAGVDGRTDGPDSQLTLFPPCKDGDLPRKMSVLPLANSLSIC